MNIAEIRQKYPQYQNVDDDTLANALHKKYYADKISIDDFKSKIGLQQPQAIPTQEAQPAQSTNPDMGQSVREMSPKERINQQINEYDKSVYGIPVLGGIKKGFDDVAMGGSQLLARGIDALTLGNTNLSKDFDKSVQDQEQAYIDANKADTSGYINDIARFGGGVISGGTGNIAGGALKKIAIGAGIGTATSPVLQERGQEGNQSEFAKQKAIQLGVGGALGGLGKGASSLTSKVADDIIPLAKRAKEFGIKLRVDQIKPTRFRKTVQKISQDIPFSGVDAQEATQRGQWHRAVAKTMDIEDLTPESIANFEIKNSNKFNDVLNGVDIAFNKHELGRFKAILTQASKDQGDRSDALNVVKNKIKDILVNFDKPARENFIGVPIPKKSTAKTTKKSGVTIDMTGNSLVVPQRGLAVPNNATDISTVRQSLGLPEFKDKNQFDFGDFFNDPDFKEIKFYNGIVSGKKLSNIRSDLIQSKKRIDPKARPYVDDMVDMIDNIMEKNISPKKVKQLQQARQEYKYYKTIEPLLEKSVNGNIDPTELKNKIALSPYFKGRKLKVGDDNLNDLANIGKQFLPKAGGSDTFAKSATAGVAGASVFSPKTLLTVTGGGALNRLGQSINKSPSNVAKHLSGGGVANKAFNAISNNANTIATQSSRMTGQAMNAMSNKQEAQQQQTVKNKSINDYFKEYEADTGTKNKRMSDYFKEYEDKPQASNETQYQFKRPDFVNDTTQAESSGNPDAKSKTSTASGLAGFTDGTWNEMKNKYGAKYGLNNKADPMQQMIATDLYAQDNEKYLKQKLKNRDISTKDLHVAHFMGANGATRLILNIQRGQGGKLAYQTFRKEANKNKPIFFDGKRPRTISEVYAVLASREK